MWRCGAWCGAGNVLLQPSHSDLRGYIAKVADFGLSGLMDTSQTHVHSRSMGTGDWCGGGGAVRKAGSGT